MTSRGRNQVRIIAGTWRGQRLRFADGPGLRPTADSNRETLFNWLQPLLPGSHCLDAFAGSGALGLEAASRGAAAVLLVERNRKAAAQLHDNVQMLEAGDRVRIHHGDAVALLRGPGRPMDVVFLDPPFAGDLLEPACQALAAGNWLRPGTRIYVEHARQQRPPVPENWHELRSRTAGDATMRLFSVAGGD